MHCSMQQDTVYVPNMKQPRHREHKCATKMSCMQTASAATAWWNTVLKWFIRMFHDCFSHSISKAFSVKYYLYMDKVACVWMTRSARLAPIDCITHIHVSAALCEAMVTRVTWLITSDQDTYSFTLQGFGCLLHCNGLTHICTTHTRTLWNK